MAKSQTDSGNWNLGSGMRPRPSIEDRTRHLLSPCSTAVVEAMRKEDAFIDSIPNRGPDLKRFTDRRAIPGRDRMIP